jgi:hypothetical protein
MEKTDRLLIGLGERLTGLAKLYSYVCSLSMELYNSLMTGDTERITELGEKLQEKEDEISILGENVHLNPIIEYVAIRRDNICEPDISKLAIKTAALYQEAQNLALGLKRRSEHIWDLISKDDRH